MQPSSFRASRAVFPARGVAGLLALTLALLLAGCSSQATEEPTGAAAVTSATPTATEPPATTVATATESTQGTTTPIEEIPLVDATLTRDDVDCTLEFLSSGGGEDFADGFTSGHFVVDGVLGQSCIGEDDRLMRAWEWLRIVAEPADLEPLILLAGFDAPSDLLAYVEALSTADGGVAFQMTVNLGEAERDDIELALTMAHELTHVFTGVPDQLDRGVDESQCFTYFEGEGCYADDSYIARWIEEFWGDWIEDIDPTNPDDDAAYDRCLVDPSFLGSYAATNPEEDFAETFSAYVFSVPVEDPGLIAKYEFMDADPYLAAFKARIQAAGIEPLPNQFEGCGF
ncbi:MAG: hypothetical protein AB7F65_05485 [Dehalococcoidia bacterium]